MRTVAPGQAGKNYERHYGYDGKDILVLVHTACIGLERHVICILVWVFWVFPSILVMVGYLLKMRIQIVVCLGDGKLWTED